MITSPTYEDDARRCVVAVTTAEQRAVQETAFDALSRAHLLLLCAVFATPHQAKPHMAASVSVAEAREAWVTDGIDQSDQG